MVVNALNKIPAYKEVGRHVDEQSSYFLLTKYISAFMLVQVCVGPIISTMGGEIFGGFSSFVWVGHEDR